MKGTTIACIVVAGAALGGGWYLYKKGRATQQAIGQDSSAASAIRAGVLSAIAEVRAATPDRKTAPPASYTPTDAGVDPRLTQRAPTHSRRALLSIVTGQRPLSDADLVKQGITPT